MRSVLHKNLVNLQVVYNLMLLLVWRVAGRLSGSRCPCKFRVGGFRGGFLVRVVDIAVWQRDPFLPSTWKCGGCVSGQALENLADGMLTNGEYP